MALAHELKESGHNARYDICGDCVYVEDREFTTIIKEEWRDIINGLWVSTFKCNMDRPLTSEYFVGGLKVDIADPDSIEEIEKWLKNLRSSN